MNKRPTARFLVLAVLLAGLAAAYPFPSFDIQAHRGGRGLLPENTLPAFEKALELGVTTLELDLAVTKDNVLVVSHDPVLNPAICAGPGGRDPAPNLAIRNLTLAELRAYDCGSRRNPAFPSQTPVPGARVPTLQEVFDLARSRSSGVLFNVETKITPELERAGLTPSADAFAALVVASIRAKGLEDKVLVQSFDFRTLRAARALEPRLATAALFSGSQAEAIADPVRAMAGLGAAVFSPNYARLTEAAVGAAKRAGYKVVPWTVNEETDMRRLIGWGVDGLISDYPDRLLKIAKEMGGR